MAEDHEILDKLNTALFGSPGGDAASQDTQNEVLLDQLAQLASIIENQQALIDAADARIEALEDQPWKPWPTPNPVLASWVEEWLIPTFQLDTVLTGWQTTPALLSELSALFGGYQQMVDPKATGWDALNWHQHRASAITRIEDHQRRHRTNPTSLGNWGNYSGADSP